jgi:hypothetical protein
MNEPYYFEIPIYRCNDSTHIEEMKILKNKYKKVDFKEIAPVSNQNLKNHIENIVCYPWRYNEIIGYICLYIMGNQIRGNYYFITSKRIGKGIRKKRFDNYGKAFEYSLTDNLSSDEIFKEIINQLKILNKFDKKFKKRYLDLDAFKTIGEFVDWKNLVTKLNVFNNQ